MALQIRRGTSADVASASFVPLIGEPLYLTDNQKLYIGDGSTQGGNAIGGATDLDELTSVTLIDESVGALSLYQVTSNTVLVTLAVGQGAYFVGLQVVISNSSVAALNGTHTITGVPTASQFAFSLTTANVTSTSVTGVVTPKIPDGNVLKWNATTNYWENGVSTSGADVVSDTSPQLGGNLDTNNKSIISIGTNNIEFDPATGQNVIFKGNATDGSGRIKLNCENNSHGIIIKGPPHSAAANYTLTLPNDDGAANTYLKSDGSGILSWDTASGISNVVEDTSPQLGGNLDVNGNDIISISNGDIDFTPNGTGAVVFKGVTSNGGNGAGRFKLNCENNSHGITIQGPPHSAAANYTLTLPTNTGTSGQVLSTNGSGSLSWATASGSASSTLHTTIVFSHGFTAPTSVISNSNEIGLNFGAWSILTSAATNGPSSSTYDPTLTGISFNSTTGFFEGFPAGRYKIDFTASVAINNMTGLLTANELYYYAMAKNNASTYFYFADFVYGILPYASYGSTSINVNVHWSMIAVFEETTAANNTLRIYADQDMGPTHYVQNGTLDILKFAGI